MPSERVLIEIATAANLTGVREAEAGISGLHKGIGVLTAGMGLATGALAALGIGIAGAFALKSAIDTTTALGERVYRMTQQFGLAAESASKWQYVAQAAGVSDESLSIGFKMLSKNLENTVLNVKELTKHVTVGGSATKVWEANVTHFTDGTSKASKILTEHTKVVKGHVETVKTFEPVADAFTRAMDTLGVKALDQRGKMRSLDAVVLELADAFNKLPASFDAAGLAQVIFGKSGIDMLPILKLGKQGILDLENEAQKYGLVISGANLMKIHDYIEAHRRLDAAMQGMQLTIGTALIPVLTGLTTNITGAFQAVRIWIDDNPRVIKSLQDLGEAGVNFVHRSIDALIGVITGPAGANDNFDHLRGHAQMAADATGGMGPDSLASSITSLSTKLQAFMNDKSTKDFINFWHGLGDVLGVIDDLFKRIGDDLKSIAGVKITLGPVGQWIADHIIGGHPFGLGGPAQTNSHPGIGGIAGATGFEGTVSRPTLFLAGEAGTEGVSIRPQGAGGGGIGGNSRAILTLLTSIDQHLAAIRRNPGLAGLL